MTDAVVQIRADLSWDSVNEVYKAVMIVLLEYLRKELNEAIQG